MKRYLVLLLVLFLIAFWVKLLSTERDPPATAPPEKTEEAVGVETPGLEAERESVAAAESPEAPVRETEPTRAPESELAPDEKAAMCGFVYDDDGNAVEGARIQVDGEDEPRVVHSDLTGAYEVDPIDPGLRWVSVRISGSAYGAAEHMLRLDFAPGERKEHDFGRPVAKARLFGYLRTRAGKGVPGGRVRASRVGDPAHARATCDDEGRFVLRLAPGTYNVSASSAANEKRHRVATEHVIDEQDRELDLELPGSSLVGKVTGLPRDFAERPRNLRVGGRLEGHDYPSAVYTVEVGADGSFRIDGLEPGTWVLSSFPLTIAPATVIVTDDAESVVELVLE